MPLTLEMVPGIGIAPIHFGMSRTEVRVALREHGIALCGERDTSDYFCESSVQVEYFETGSAEFVGVACHPEVRLLFKGLDVFSMDAKQSFQLFASGEHGSHRFVRTEYRFPVQIITLWDADRQYDHIGGQKRLTWGQIGLGSAAYREAVEAIECGT